MPKNFVIVWLESKPKAPGLTAECGNWIKEQSSEKWSGLLEKRIQNYYQHHKED